MRCSMELHTVSLCKVFALVMPHPIFSSSAGDCAGGWLLPKSHWQLLRDTHTAPVLQMEQVSVEAVGVLAVHCCFLESIKEGT